MKQSALKFSVLFMFAFFLSCSAGERSVSVLEKTFKGNRLLSEGVNRIYIDKISDGNISSVIID